MNKFFKNIDHALSFAEKGLSESIHVKTLVKAGDYVSWQKKLVKEADLESYLLRGKYNLLILAVAAGIDMDPAIPSLNNFHASKLMAALDSYLNLFPFLLKDKKFISKLKNLDGLIATICELSLAKYFHSAGYKVSFETPFQNMTSSTTKDVDLSVTDKLGNTIHFEIYMPVHAIEVEGFFAPEEEDHHFEYKVMKKLDDKFGSIGIQGISGKIFLAVNIDHYDELRTKRLLFGGNDELFMKAKTHLPNHIDGVLFFRDEFISGSKIAFDGLITK